MTIIESENCLPNGGRHLMPMIRVACITLHGTTLIIAADRLQENMIEMGSSTGQTEGDESDTYSIKFKTMLVRDYEALGEFDGF